MKKITLLLSFIVCVIFAQAQVLLVEDFNYPIGSDIKSHGWPIHSGSGATKDSITVVPGLTFSGYIGSGIGNAVADTGRFCDQNHVFASQTAGLVYASFMVKPIAAGAAATYFLHFAPTLISSNTFFTRVWVNATGTGLGIGSTVPTTYSPIVLNTTYLVIIKYDFSTKTSSLFIFNALPTAEPTTAQATFIETTGPAAATPTDIGTIAIRQGQTSGVSNQKLIIDGIRVTKSYNDLFTATNFFTPKVDALSVSLSGNTLTVNNAANGSTVDVYSTVGAKVQTSKLENNTIQLNNLSKGLYVVRVGNMSSKIMM